MNIDSGFIKSGIEFTTTCIEERFSDFKEYAEHALEEFGEKALPYIRSWWNCSADIGGFDIEEVSKKEADEILAEIMQEFEENKKTNGDQEPKKRIKLNFNGFRDLILNSEPGSLTIIGPSGRMMKI